MSIQNIGDNVRRHMKIQGLTIPQLSTEMGMGTAALSNLLNGKAEPKSSTLIKLASALKVTFDELLADTPQLQSLRFRTGKTLSGREKAAKDQLRHDTALWLSDYRYLEDSLNTRLAFGLSDIPGSGPVEIAANIRKRLRIDPNCPIHDISNYIERSGIKLRLRPFGFKRTFGLSVGEMDGGPAIVVNAEADISIERQIFTIVHELGHIVMHKDSYNADDDIEIDDEEYQANSFAGHFLVPDEGLRNAWEALRGLHWVDAVLHVKKEFKVSYRTVLYRLKDIYPPLRDRLLERDFAIQYNERYKHDLKDFFEPEALSASDLVESRFLGLVRRALDSEIISIGRAAEILGISMDEMRKRAFDWHDGV